MFEGKQKKFKVIDGNGKIGVRKFDFLTEGIVSGETYTETAIRKLCGGWIETEWDGTAEHFNRMWSDATQLVDVTEPERKFKVLPNDGILSSYHGQVLTEEFLRERFGGWIKEDWDGTAEEFNRHFPVSKIELASEEVKENPMPELEPGYVVEIDDGAYMLVIGECDVPWITAGEKAIIGLNVQMWRDTSTVDDIIKVHKPPMAGVETLLKFVRGDAHMIWSRD